MFLLRAGNLAQRADHGSHRADIARRQKHPGQRGSLLQNMQQRQKTTSAHGVGRIPQTIQLHQKIVIGYLQSENSTSIARHPELNTE